MNTPSNFYRELESDVRMAWKLDRKRTIREGIELLICFGFFLGAVVLIYIL